MNRGLYPNPAGERQFVSREYALTTETIEVPHGLGGVPSLVRWVFVCKEADNEYLPGDEVTGRYIAGDGANRSTVWMTGLPTSGTITFYKKNAGTLVNLASSYGKWRMKCYASL